MAKILLRDSFTIHSDLGVEAIAVRLSQSICSAPAFSFNWPWQKPRVPYYGQVTLKGFDASRVINYQNSFLPKIQGHFETLPSGTAIHITVAPEPWVKWFCGVWVLFWCGLVLPLIPAASANGANGTALLFLGMPLAFFGIAWASFWAEAKRNRRDFQQMIGDRILQSGKHRIASRSPMGFGFIPPSQTRFNPQLWILTGLGLAVIVLFILLQQQQAAQKIQVATNPLAVPDAVCAAPCQYETLHSITGHPKAKVVAVSPDGSLVASGGDDKAIKVWDVETGQLLQTLQSDSGKILDLAIAPDNQTIVSGAGDRMLRIWKLNADSEWPQMLKHVSKPRIIRITQDGTSIISASFHSLKRWNLVTGALEQTLVDGDPRLTQLGPFELVDHDLDTRILAINSTGQVAVVEHSSKLLAWNLDNNQQVELPVNSYLAHVGNLAISPNGKVAASQHNNNWRKFETRLKVWDLNQGKLQTEGAMAFSRRYFRQVPMVLSDAQVLGSVNGELMAWDFDNAQRGKVLSQQSLGAIALSPDNKVLAGLENVGSSGTTIKLLQRQ